MCELEGGVKKHRGKCRMKVCKSKDGGLNDALKLARRVRSRTMGSSEVPRSSSVGAAGDQGHGDAQQPIARAAQAKIFAPAAPATSQFLRGPR